MPNNRKPIEKIQTQEYAEQVAKFRPNAIDVQNPEPPPGKTQVWQDFFNDVLNNARMLGTLSKTDIRSVLEFCDIHEEVHNLKRSLMGPNGEEVYTDIGSTGQSVVRPEYIALLKVRAQYHKMLSEFGMTPRGRAYVYDESKKPENKVEALLQKLKTNGGNG